MSQYLVLINKMLPERFSQNDFDSLRARILLAIILFNVFYWFTLHIVTTVIMSKADNPSAFPYHAVFISILATQVFSLYLFCAKGLYRLAAHINILVILCFFSVIAYCVGAESGSGPYTNLLTIVALSFLLLSLRASLFWSLICLVLHISYTLLPAWGISWQPVFSGGNPVNQSYFESAAIALVYSVLIAAFWAFMSQNKTLSKQLLSERFALDRQTKMDALTGVSNRHFFDLQLTTVIEQQQYFALLYIDLDNFKPINDTHGHQVGDEVLRHVALRMRRIIRESDIVSRLGGDEFGIILQGIHKQKVNEIARKITDEIARPIKTAKGDMLISCSVGISICPEHGTDAQSLVRSADKAMYEAKAEGDGFCYAQGF
ncbi:GGDEF domain-containing protein [Oceanicoccus sagamiensis]|uniref:GGDEF domain-containing protein n=1 Tax=Oceanicoccus sagamiensis TaxID=716816 RepID=A0A1X9N3U3_9GAMM|nr:GGDEF domain-containing protein [Oceanicoccus sagamiensis]ARN72858.1 hypothetical protein BST96_01290 [Oceanicoccus sagamiensis]